MEDWKKEQSVDPFGDLSVSRMSALGRLELDVVDEVSEKEELSKRSSVKDIPIIERKLERRYLIKRIMSQIEKKERPSGKSRRLAT